MRLKGDNITNDDFSINLLENIKKHVPEFHTEIDREEFYFIMFDFSKFFEENIGNTETIHRCIKVIDEALLKGTSITHELVSIEFFPILRVNETLKIIVRENLSDENKKVFDQYISH